VPRFSQKTFEQAAGFLRIPDSENPLDNTGVHPERYSLLEGFATKLGKSVRELVGAGAELVRKARDELMGEIGAFTFDDILGELEKPGRDPVKSSPFFSFERTSTRSKTLKRGWFAPVSSRT